MLGINGPSADAVWRRAVKRLAKTAPVQDGRDQPTRELLHVTFTINDPRQRMVFGRPINPAFAIAEVIWIMAGANDSNFLLFWNKRMAQFIDNNSEYFHGAYGFRLGSQPKLYNHVVAQFRRNLKVDQLRAAYEALKAVPESRQVVLQIWDHTQDLPNPFPRSKDIPCNLLSHLLIRNGKLEWLQVMRSNDLIWGTPYNFIQFTTMQEIMAGWLGIDVGTYSHVSDSLHVYQRHWNVLDSGAGNTRNRLPTNRADLRLPYEKWEAVWTDLIELVTRLRQIKNAADMPSVLSILADAPAGYREWGALLTAEAIRRAGDVSLASQVIKEAGYYYETSWRQWAESVRRPAPKPA